MYYKSLIAGIIFFLSMGVLAMKPMTDDEIRRYILDNSMQKFQQISRCVCPFNKDQNNVTCGENSLYFTLQENKPKCFTEDVKSYDIDDFRSFYDIPASNYDQSRNYNSPGQK